MYQITNEQYEEWRNALLNAQAGHSDSTKAFKSKYPELYKHISSMLRKRTKLRNILGAFKSVSKYVYWGHLTWNDEHNVKDEKTKRKQALRFLDKFFKLFCFVEEYGEENERYHIHFFGVLKDKETSYETMYQSWHSRIEIECLKPGRHNEKVKYLTKYAVKQVPRIRMNNRAVKLLEDYKRYKHMIAIGFEFYADIYKEKLTDIKEMIEVVGLKDEDLPF